MSKPAKKELTETKKTVTAPKAKKIANKNKKTVPLFSFGSALNNFTMAMEVGYESFMLTEKLVKDKFQETEKSFDTWVKTNATKKTKTGFTFSGDKATIMMTQFNDFRKSLNAVVMVPNNMFVGIVSQFDTLLVNIAKLIFIKDPKKLDKKISEKINKEDRYEFKLSDFKSIDTLRDFLIDHQIELIMRQNRNNQFGWLKESSYKNEDIQTKLWPELIEISQRRNHIVHNDCKISEIYIKNCRDASYKFVKDPEVGQSLNVSMEYFKNSFMVLYEIGIKTHFSVWKNYYEDKENTADEILNNICVELIKKEHYKLASNILDYAMEKPSEHEEGNQILFLVNKLQVLKWMGEKEKFDALIKTKQWDQYSNLYRLVISVLVEDYEKASQFMNVVTNKEVREIDYKEWPIFKEFIKSDIFLAAYKKKFKKNFVVSDEEVKEIMDKKIITSEN